MKALRQPGGIQSPGGFGAFVNTVCNNVFEMQELPVLLGQGLDEIFDPRTIIVDVNAGRELAGPFQIFIGSQVTP